MLSLHAVWVVRAGNASAFVCQDDEACTVAAAKEGANKATNFTWVQLRDLGSFLEQRSWHRSAVPSTTNQLSECNWYISSAWSATPCGCVLAVLLACTETWCPAGCCVM